VGAAVDGVVGNSGLVSELFKINGWYLAPPTVTLTPVDPTSGIASTKVSVDGGAFVTYSAPLTGFSTGNHTAQYRTTDFAGRVESAKLIAFKADSDKPVVNIVKPATATVLRA